MFQNSVLNKPKLQYTKPEPGKNPISFDISSAAKAYMENKKAPADNAVREYAVSKGLDNNKIGWDDANKTVMYDGQPLIKPTRISNGTSYANASDIDNAIADYKKNNANVAVRNQMVSDGFLNNGIGFNQGTGKITYNGAEIASPAKLENGVSYMTQEDYDKMVKSLGQGYVNAADYASSLGLGNSISYNNDGTISFLGGSAPIQQIKTDGNNSYALVKKSDLDNIYGNFAKNNPTVFQAFNEWNNQRGRIDRALEKIENQPEFEYNLERDPNYRAYMEAAIRNGEAAYEDTLAKNAAMTGGFASSNAIMAAQQAKQGYLDALNDRIPQLYQAAYERYNAERNREFDRLSSILNTSSNVFGNDLQAAVYLNQLVNDAYDRNRARRNDEYNRELSKEDTAYQRGVYEDETEYNRKVYEDEVARNNRLNALNAYMQLLGMTENGAYLNTIHPLVSGLY